MSNQQEHHQQQQQQQQQHHQHLHNHHHHHQLQHQNSDATLQQEIDDLKGALIEKEAQLIACMQETDRQVELEDSIIAWQDKYERLYDSHKRVQKVNQNLEDKLLKLVERGESKNAQLTSDVATLSVRLAQANYNISLLQREIERYKTDMGLAIQLLQCKPDSFVPQKINSKLPVEIQAKLRKTYMRVETNSQSDSEGSVTGGGTGGGVSGGGGVINGVTTASNNTYSALPDRSDSPIIENNKCPFQPTSMVYSMRSIDSCTAEHQLNISPSVMVKFLEDELKTSETKHCDTCNCPNRDMTVLAILPRTYSVGTQTTATGDTATNNSLCLRCNSNLNSPSRTNSPYMMMKLVKSSDSVISETKSSVSNSTQNDKLFTPAKKDDIMVNPILGHHRLCTGAKVAATVAPLIATVPASTVASPKAGNSINNDKSNVSLASSLDLKCKTANVVVTNATKEVKKVDDTDLLLLHHTDDTLNDTDDNDEAVNENTSLLGTISTAASGGGGGVGGAIGSLLTPKSKSNNIANKLLLKSPELMGGAKPKTPEVKKPNISLKQCSDQFDVDKKSESLRGPGNGSTNSIWSRTSSRDGSKIFENFNRNLIKTIKAENPKMKGPRICALRIQNGSNNILLDNSEGENLPTPIVYTRRSRLMDEELDDEKDVTLAVEKTASSAQTDTQLLLDTKPIPVVVNNNVCDTNGATASTTSRPTSTQAKHNRISTSSIASEMDLRRQQLSRVAEWVQNNSKMNDMSKTHSTSVSDIDIDILSFDGSTTQSAAATNRNNCNTMTTTMAIGINNSSSNNNNNNVNGSSAHKSNGTIDEMLMATTIVGTPGIAKNFISDQQPTTVAAVANGCTSSNDFAQQQQLQLQHNNNKAASINLYKYFELYAQHEDDDDDDLLENENESYEENDDYDEDNSEKNLDDENQIDLAQMEYNVKQFLLKQSEWSIHNKLSAIGVTGVSSGDTMMKSIPQRTETNL